MIASNSGSSTICRITSARSYGEELCPDTSRPDGVPATAVT